MDTLLGRVVGLCTATTHSVTMSCASPQPIEKAVKIATAKIIMNRQPMTFAKDANVAMRPGGVWKNKQLGTHKSSRRLLERGGGQVLTCVAHEVRPDDPVARCVPAQPVADFHQRRGHDSALDRGQEEGKEEAIVLRPSKVCAKCQRGHINDGDYLLHGRQGPSSHSRRHDEPMAKPRDGGLPWW